MTDCRNAECRDQLPDLVNGTLAAAEHAAVQAHLVDCQACTDEVALIRVALAVRLHRDVTDVAAIVRQLPRPIAAEQAGAPTVIALHAAGGRRSRWRAQAAWRMAAGVGLLIAGGWSIHLVRSGSVAMLGSEPSDSVQLAAAAESIRAVPTGVASGTVAIGNISDYTDEELERLLERVDRWDGATAADAGTVSTPILPVQSGGTTR